MLTFRNIDGNSHDPVQSWGVEGILAVLERGGLEDWGALYEAISKDSPYQEQIREELEEAIIMTQGGYLGEHVAQAFSDLLHEAS